MTARTDEKTFIEGVGRKGTRIAKDSGGKNIKIPENMKYADYEKVYIKKEATFEDWQKNNLNDATTNGKMSGDEIGTPRGKSTLRMSRTNGSMNEDKIKWTEKNNDNVLTKEEFKSLREFAKLNEIALAGFKTFDGSLAVIKESIVILNELKRKFPQIADERYPLTLSLVSYLDPNDFAETNVRVISLNENAFRNLELLKKEYQKLVDEGFFVKGTDYRAIIHHEFGHVVSNVYKIDSMEIACEITGNGSIATLDFARKNLSKYAGKLTDGSEIIAEVFSDMSSGSPSEFSRKFYEKVIQITRGR